MPKRILKFTEAFKEATDQLMQKDKNVFVAGLGVSYPNGTDGMTAGLKEKYPERILDTPVSEHAVTGMAVGAAISGLKPIVHHGRVEFSMLAVDQMFTQAAKWNYMFGGNNPVPLIMAIAVGRQWGNGPQHTQSLYGMFGSVAGLKVVIPSTPFMAKGLLAAAHRDNNPIVMLLPRWVYQVKEDVPEKLYTVALDKSRIVKKGTDITVVAYGDGLIAAIEALEILGEKVSVELIDVVSINPIDHKTIAKSVTKTGRLLTVDTTHENFSIGSEVIASVSKVVALKQKPIALTTPNVPCPTSTVLTEEFYPTKVDIVNSVLKALGKKQIKQKLSFEELHLAPTILI